MFEKTKQHVRDNKKVYIAAGIGLVVGGAATYVVLLKKTPPAEVDLDVNVKGVFYKSPVTIDIVVEALGDPGNVIQDVTDGVRGTVYASQGQLARTLGVNPARVSEHLSGSLPHINGRVFEKLGKAAAA